MNKVAIAIIAAFAIAPAALAQSFNGGGRMSASSPTGWGANPNGYLNTNTQYGQPWGGGKVYYPGENGFNNQYATPYGTTFGNPYAYGNYPGANVYNNGFGPRIYPFGNPYVAPVALGNGLYSFNGGGVSANLWRAPSGYYYPWGVGANPYGNIVYVDQSGGKSQTVVQQPPLSMQFTDMNQFLDDAFKNGKISESDYKSMKQRLKDIQGKERSYRIAGDGYLEDSADAEIRQNLKDFAKLMTERIKL
jgi:hypothetical protein